MANLKQVKDSKAKSMGLHKEVLTGRTQQVFFNSEEAENFFYYGAYDVDFNNRTEVDVTDQSCKELNDKLNSLIEEGYGTIVVKNPQGKHSLGVGILNKLNLIFEGSLGYFGVGSIDGPIVRITGRVGWSCAENMMAGKVVVEKNAGSCFGAAVRGGDLICKGSVGARTGIDMKGGTIMIGGDAGAFTGFMMQRGRIIILGNTGPNLGDSMYDGTIFVGGTIKSLGSDAKDVWLYKTDMQGNALTIELFGGSSDEIGKSVRQTNDGGFIVAGFTESFGNGSSDIWLIKTDSDCNQEWSRTFGGSNNDYGESVRQTNDGGFIIAGWTNSSGSGGYDFWLIKTDPEGNAGSSVQY